MDSWPAPAVPRISGQPEALRVFDTSSQQLRVAAAGPIARLYVCGITPYDATHIGHAATFLAFDLMNRFWQDAGLDVRYVQNVTDVDDPLLERATATGQDWSELARAETALFRQDMTALRILPPAEFVGAVESIPEVVHLITELQRRGAAYYVDKDVYFSVGSDEDFGRVSSLDRDTMLQKFGERGGDPDRSGKKDPLDCLLWQAQRPSEPAWDTDLGHGRPGWHIECAAIALDRLAMSIDVQGGGSDLAFPHHEMSASEAQVAMAQRPFARTYVHAGMVALDGTKMSKSKGNLVFVSRLLDDGHDPMAIRLALLAHHYRSDWEWTDKDLEQATHRLHLWHTAVTAESGPDASPVVNEVRACLAADLDAPSALRILDRWADDATGASKHNDRAAPRGVADLVDSLLGVDLCDRS